MKHGFTLLELSIVLVIIGLIAGGILVGQDMIKSAQLKSTASRINEFSTALNTFTLKYNAIPGDIPNATAYQLHLDGAGTNVSCAIGGIFTFNGRGTGILGGYKDWLGPSYSGELANFYVHLSNAGLIKDGIVAANASSVMCQDPVVAGVNYPAVDIGGGIITISDTATRTLYHVLGGMGQTHSTDLGHSWAGNRFSDYLYPADAERIDRKMDDGEPLAGAVKVADSTVGYLNDVADTGAGYVTFDTADSATNCIYNGAYNFTYDTRACTLLIETGR